MYSRNRLLCVSIGLVLYCGKVLGGAHSRSGRVRRANEHEDRVVPERLIKFEGQALGIVNGSVVNSFDLFQFVILEIQ